MINDKSMSMDDYYPVPLSERAKPVKPAYVEPPRPRKGDLKPSDANDLHIINNADYFVVNLIQFGTFTRVRAEFKSIEECKQYSIEELNKNKNFRVAMTYAVNEYGRSTLVCSVRDGEDFKYPKLNTY